MHKLAQVSEETLFSSGLYLFHKIFAGFSGLMFAFSQKDKFRLFSPLGKHHCSTIYMCTSLGETYYSGRQNWFSFRAPEINSELP